MIKLKKLLSEKLDTKDDSNLHGDDRTQRQFVMDLAAQSPFGLISISDIADALHTTRDAIHNNYARLIRYYDDRDDFQKIVPEVPFRSAAVYQLVSRSKSAPLSKEQLDKIRQEEEKKYDDTTGTYYAIYRYTKEDANPMTIAYLNLREDDNIKNYEKKLPKQQEIYGDMYYYGILPNKMNRLSPEKKEKVITPSQFDDFIREEFESD